MKLVSYIVLVLLIVLALGAVFMLLWNWIVPYIFHGPEISIWMAWGIMLLVGLLFRGLRRS